VYSVATDGLISSVEIDELKVGTSLGTWEKTKIIEGFLVKPGVYKWLDNFGEWHYGTRGFTKDEAKWDEIEGLWDRKEFVKKWKYPANRFIGLMQAWHRGESWREWFGKWIESEREMGFHPTLYTRTWDIDMGFYIPIGKYLNYGQLTYEQIVAKITPFFKLKYECWCKREWLLSAAYQKIEDGGSKEFFQFLVDEDQP
jgi:hypothetical protein